MIGEKAYRNLIALSLLIAGSYFFSEIVFPLIFAFIAALALLGPSQWFERIGLPRSLSIIVTLIIPITLVAGLSVFYYFQFDSFMSDLPDFSKKSEETAREINEAVDDAVNVNIEAEIEKAKRSAGGLLESGSEFITTTISAFSSVISFVVLIPVYVFFILYSREYLKRFLQRHNNRDNENRILDFFSDAKTAMMAYGKGLASVILIVGILNTLGLFFIGVDYPVLLGSFSALLIIIPYIGVFVGALIPAIVVFVTKESLTYPLLVIGWYSLVQFLEGNIITPKIVGAQIDLNPLAIIVFLLFMGVIGGLIGLIVAVPLLALIKLFLDHHPELSDYGLLLESKTDHKKS